MRSLLPGPLRGLLCRPWSRHLPLQLTPARHLSSTPPPLARPSTHKPDARVTLIRYHLQHPLTPRPLRLSRLRALRHWTIGRAAALFARQRREAQAAQLERLHNSMHAACEALRQLEGPAAGGGRLYRIAIEKRGVWGPGGVPIEYARTLVDTPGREAWNHDWKR